MGAGQQKFAKLVGEWVTASRERMLAVRNTSVERLVEQIQTPVGQGGNLPVDTGFLRASLVAVIGDAELPTQEKPKGVVSVPMGDALAPVLANARLEDTITIGWTANYARYAENKHAFMRLGIQRWPQIVALTAAEATLRGHDRRARR